MDGLMYTTKVNGRSPAGVRVARVHRISTTNVNGHKVGRVLRQRRGRNHPSTLVVLTLQETVHLLSWYSVNGHVFAGLRVARVHRLQDALGERARLRVPRGRARDTYHRSQWTVLISTTNVNGRF